MVGGKQITIVWYIDNNNLLHVDINVVTDILEQSKKHFEDLVVRRGDTHNLLRIYIYIKKYKNVELIMKHQIEGKVSQFKDICGFQVTLMCL